MQELLAEIAGILGFEVAVVEGQEPSATARHAGQIAMYVFGESTDLSYPGIAASSAGTLTTPP